MGKTIAEMTAEIRAVNIEKGWRPAGGGPGENTWGDYVALLHSEISETLEAYRDHRLSDATVAICGRAANGEEPCPEHGPSKPEGVGSEFADVLIRLLDMCDVFGISPIGQDKALSETRWMWATARAIEQLVSFGDWMTWLHSRAEELGRTRGTLAANRALGAVVITAEHFGIDLDAEYARKIAYNKTRAFHHGGRAF